MAILRGRRCSSCGGRRRDSPVAKTLSTVVATERTNGTIVIPAPSEPYPTLGALRPLVRNYQMMPPTGGWNVHVRISGRTHFMIGAPTMIVDKIMSVYRNVGEAMTEQRVWDVLNHVWMARDPARAVNAKGGFVLVEPPVAAKTLPAQYGPDLWLSLHKLGNTFNKAGWDAAVAAATKVLDVKTSPATGCEECFALWSQIRLNDNPASVDDAESAATWSWKAHNVVNERLGKPQMTLETASIIHNWKNETP